MKNVETKPYKEIPRFPICPELSKKQIETITEIVYILPNPQPADLLFVFGSSQNDEWGQVADLYHRNLAPLVYVAGGKSGKAIELGRILSHMIRDALVSYGVQEQAIIMDEESTNTLEDAVFGKALFKKMSIPHKRILFACKWPHGGRCLRTLKKTFPDSELFPFMYDFKYNDIPVTSEIRNTWWKHEMGRSFTWGEYQRILSYASRGDIA